LTDKKEGSSGAIEGAVKTVTELAKAVPIYQDAVQPAAKELGKSLETMAKAVNVALAPVSGLVWGYDQLRGFVNTKLAEKFENVEESDIVSPPPNIAGPALESLRYTGAIEELQELYANLLASSMDMNTSENVHPSFVDIIKQLTPDEAKILTAFKQYAIKSIYTGVPAITVVHHGEDVSVERLRNFSDIAERTGCEKPQLCASYFDNLCRLGILDIIKGRVYGVEAAYEQLEQHPTVLSTIEEIESFRNSKAEIVSQAITITEYGKLFVQACVIDHRDY